MRSTSTVGKRGATKSTGGRKLRFEGLERRSLLSVTGLDITAIGAVLPAINRDPLPIPEHVTVAAGAQVEVDFSYSTDGDKAGTTSSTNQHCQLWTVSGTTFLTQIGSDLAKSPDEGNGPHTGVFTIDTTGLSPGTYGVKIMLNHKGNASDQDPNSTETAAGIAIANVTITPTVSATADTVAYNGATYATSHIHPTLLPAGAEGNGSLSYTFYAAADTATPLPGAPTDAGNYDVVVHFAANAGSGYNNADSGLTPFVINRADADVVVKGYTGTYDALAHGASLDHAKGVGGVDLSADVSLGDQFTNVPGGTACWSFSDPNYNPLGGEVPIVINRAGADVVVKGYTGTYDALAHGASLDHAKGVGGVDLSADVSLGDQFTNVPGGTACWSFSDPNYNPLGGEVPIVINRADADVVVKGYTGTYDALAHGASLDHAKGVGGVDLSADVSLGDQFTNVPGGTACWSFSDPNYNPLGGEVPIVINRADADVVVKGYTGTYDALAHGASLDHAKGVGGVDLSADVTLGDQFTNVPGGTACWSFSDPNYNPLGGEVPIVINRADADVVVKGYTGTYDALAHGASLDHAKGVGGVDLSADVSLGDQFTNVPGGTACWSFSDPNYNPLGGEVPIVINRADADVVVKGYTGTYDALAHGASLDHAKGVGGVDLSADVSLGDQFTNVPGGTAHWNFSDPNYNPLSGEVAIVINRADADVVVKGYTGTYDAVAHGAILDHAKGVGGVDLSADVSLGDQFTNVPGGTACWNFSDPNYNPLGGEVPIVINRADADVVVKGYTGTYDALAHGASLDHAKGVGGADLSADVSLGDQFTNVPGGTAHWSFSDPNYNPLGGEVAIVINRADARITVNGYNVTYDGSAHTATGKALGVKGEVLAGLDLAGTTHTHGGTYADKWTFTDVTGNYKSTSGQVTDIIGKATLSGVATTQDALNIAKQGSLTIDVSNIKGIQGPDTIASVFKTMIYTLTIGTHTYTFQPTVTVLSPTEVDIVYSLKNGGPADPVNGYTLAQDLLAISGGATSASKTPYKQMWIDASNQDYTFADQDGGDGLDFFARLFSSAK